MKYGELIGGAKQKPQSVTSSTKTKTTLTDLLHFDHQETDVSQEIEDVRKLLAYFKGIHFADNRATLRNRLKDLVSLQHNLNIDRNSLHSYDATNLMTPYNLLEYYYRQSTQSPVQKLGKACELPTPNGKKSKLPLDTYNHVRTDNFKEWFGDWELAYDTGDYSDCSILIDDSTKEPRIMYHAVRKYDKSARIANMGQGIKRPYGEFNPPNFPASYFGDNVNYVNFYRGEAKNQPKPSPNYQGFLYNIFINMRNPIILKDLPFKATYQNIIDLLLVRYGIRYQGTKSLIDKIGGIDKPIKVWTIIRNDIKLIESMKLQGYDGIIQEGDVPTFGKNGEMSGDLKGIEYLTFYPSQVKSANVKNSLYLGFFDDIRFKRGGNVSI